MIVWSSHCFPAHYIKLNIFLYYKSLSEVIYSALHSSLRVPLDPSPFLKAHQIPSWFYLLSISKSVLHFTSFPTASTQNLRLLQHPFFLPAFGLYYFQYCLFVVSISANLCQVLPWEFQAWCSEYFFSQRREERNLSNVQRGMNFLMIIRQKILKTKMMFCFLFSSAQKESDIGLDAQ